MAGQITQPIIVIDPSKEHVRGKDALQMNITAALAVSNMVKSTFGPSGMDKMLVDVAGDVTITNDGETILRKIAVEHPSAKTIVSVANTQEKEVGDGTTASVMFAGELLKRAGGLLERGIHPTTVITGYKLAEQKSQEILGELAIDVAEDDTDLLQSVAATAMVGKAIAYDKLAPICVRAIQLIKNGDIDVFNNVRIQHSVGKSIEDAELITGIVIDKRRVHDAMPKRVKDAHIALLTSGIEFRKFAKAPGGKTNEKMKVTSSAQLEEMYVGEESAIKSDVDSLYNIGVNAVFCTQSITESAQTYLVKRGILGVARVNDNDLEAISRATGATILANIVDVEEIDLGTAGIVEEKGSEDEELIYIKDCPNPKTVSIVVRGGTEHVLDTVEGAISDALRVVADVVKANTVVAGGGACETELSLRLRDYARTIGGKEQLAVDAFADALETLPHTLVENAGLNSTELMTMLKAKHIAGGTTSGIDVYNGDVIDMYENGVIEPLQVKTQSLKFATDAAVMILKVDDVLASERRELAPKPGQAPHDFDRF
ncbi:MAG: thermosome subunit alpha [Euryarchaeota archaeon]|nr:thermosome subunit alpha [Euryarchaeota archaeon]